MIQLLDECGTEAADGLSHDDVPSLDGLLTAGATDFQLRRLLILGLEVLPRSAWCSRFAFSESSSALGAWKSERLFHARLHVPTGMWISSGAAPSAVATSACVAANFFMVSFLSKLMPLFQAQADSQVASSSSKVFPRRWH